MISTYKIKHSTHMSFFYDVHVRPPFPQKAVFLRHRTFTYKKHTDDFRLSRTKFAKEVGSIQQLSSDYFM